ncbi:MAG: hypothetical protein WC729_19070 [Sphingomonas sp.]|jgi:hypothetical protein|uniref:hypothetical protein n=1 Tax=Sphingomonas sp. TaxID=28214 RepID=UPI00356B3132
MTLSFKDDRLTQLLFANDERADVADERFRLDSIALVVTIDDAAVRTDWGQAAAMALAVCGSRMFRGGVFLRQIPEVPAQFGTRVGQPLRRALEDLGCRASGEAPKSALRLHIGHAGNGQDLHITARGWTASVTPKASALQPASSNVVVGVLAAAIAVGEAFRRLALRAPDACRVPQIVNAWQPGFIEEPEGAIARLPTALWLLGAGNLGQAILFLLSMLPFADRRAVTLFVQDNDRSGPENLSTQVLTSHSWLGRKKAAAASAHMEALGFTAYAIERRFTNRQGPSAGEPRIALVGVDNEEARLAAATAGFDLVLDSGLGGTPAQIFDLEFHAFPGATPAEKIWIGDKRQNSEKLVPERYRRLVELGVIDACGMTTVAGQAVGVPATALAAAALQVAQLCRALATNSYCDAIDLRLARCSDSAASLYENAGLSLEMLAPACS